MSSRHTNPSSNEELPDSIIEYNKKLAIKFKNKKKQIRDESFVFLTEEERKKLEVSQNISISFMSIKDKEPIFLDKELSIIQKSNNNSPRSKNKSFYNSFLEGINFK